MHTVPLAEAARWLDVDEQTVRALVNAGYLNAAEGGLPLIEIRAFQARNAEGGAGAAMSAAVESTDPKVLLDALGARTDDLAQEAYHRFVREIPEARQWSESQRTAFIQQASGRFAAILAVTGHGSEVDDSLRRDLEAVGANAAWAGSSLPHLLLILRISRDLLLQTALRFAHERDGRLDATLAAFAARMMPAIDRLTDALADGYWEARLDVVREEWHRLDNLLDRIPYGVYEADIDGIIHYANPALGALVGSSDEKLEGLPLTDVLRPADRNASTAGLLSEPPGDVGQVSFTVEGADGEPVALDIDTVIRRAGDDIVGFGGIVRRATSTLAKPDPSVLVRHVEELRRSLAILIEAGDFLARHAEQMQGPQVVQAGESVRRQGERLLVIVDELDADRKAVGL